MMRTLLQILALVAPAAAILIAMPVALGPFAGDPRGFFGPYFLTALPVWVAVLAAPGYVATLMVDPGRLFASRLGRWWAGVSLVAVAICSLIGVLAAYWMFLFFVPSLLSLISASVLLLRVFRR
jgi:uncharacterized membrane protein